MSASSQSPSPSGSAPADPSHPPPPSPEEIAELKTAALDALDCGGQLRIDLELAIELMAAHSCKRGLQMIADNGCSHGVEASVGFWYQLGDDKIAILSTDMSAAFVRLMKRQQASAERVTGNCLPPALAQRAVAAMAVHGDPTGNPVQYSIS